MDFPDASMMRVVHDKEVETAPRYSAFGELSALWPEWISARQPLMRSTVSGDQVRYQARLASA
jgi:hypothetical protein